MANPDLGGLGASFAGSAGSVTTIIIGIVVITVVAVAAYLAYNLMRYKYKVIIASRRSNGTKTIIDRGAMIKTPDGVWYLKLLKHRASIKPVDNSFVAADNTIRLRHLGEDIYFPYTLAFDDEAERVVVEKIDYDETLTWFFSFKKLVHEKYGWVDMLEKYGTIISIGVVCFVFLMGIYFMSENFAQYIQVVSKLIESNANRVPGL